MKIIPNYDMLIEGKHSPAGEVATASEAIARDLIAQGLAKRAPADGEKLKEPAPVETAEAKPAREAVTLKAGKRG